jgi:hypothetical protein
VRPESDWCVTTTSSWAPAELTVPDLRSTEDGAGQLSQR